MVELLLRGLKKQLHLCTNSGMNDHQTHWENVYASRQPHEVSWTQAVPQTSLDFIRFFHLPRTAAIIDIGGGDSKLVDFLLTERFENITVLDISAKALDRAKARLGEKAAKVKWVVQDITAFEPGTAFDLWHDRAAFHFLTTAEQVAKYVAAARKSIKAGGYAVIGTFSDKGPDKCSGLPVQRYTEETLALQLGEEFTKIKCMQEDHTTPFDTKQHFLFCAFRRKQGGDAE
jgi:SAM-dependent methyltransferase